MLNRTATLTLLLLGLFALVGAMGCGGGDSPILPDADASLAAADTQTDDGDRETAGSEFSGVLTDSDGDPLAWAELYLDGELAGWTREDGSFTIYGLEEDAEVTLEAQIDGNVVYTTVLTPVSRSAQEFGDDDPDIQRGRVFGFVHDQFGPVGRALVVVFNNTENFGVDFSNERGFYDIPDAPAGPCLIVGFAPQHAVGRDTVFVIPDGEVQKNLFLPKKLNFGIVGGLVVTGPPRDMRPIPHARVALRPASAPEDAPLIIARTNRYGVYVMRPVPLGPARMHATALCFNEANRIVLVHPGRNFQSFHLEPSGCGGVEGTVRTPDGEPIPHALVVLSRERPDGDIWRVWQFTGPLGHYRFNMLPPGQYLLHCEKRGFEEFNQPVPVFPDQYTVVNIVLHPLDDPGG